MKAGFAQLVITPKGFIRMGGYRLRQEDAKGTHDNLQAGCAVFTNDETTIALIALDLIALDEQTSLDIKAAIQQRTGIKPDNILLSSSHTHSGPDTMFLRGEDEKVRQYCKELAPKLAELTGMAAARLKQVKVSILTKDVQDIAFNRRLILDDGGAWLNVKKVCEDRISKRGPIDPQLSSLFIEDDSGILAVIINFTLHPTILGEDNYLYSRDYPGFLKDSVCDALQDKAVVLFFNGTFGNINQIKKPGNWISTFEEAERIGKTLAQHLLDNIDQRTSLDNLSLGIISKMILIPHRKTGYENTNEIDRRIKKLQEQIGDSHDDDHREQQMEICFLNEAKYLLQLGHFTRAQVQVLKIGELEIVALPGEVFVEYGLKLKETSQSKHCLVFGNSSSYVGYVPLKESFAQGSYEARLALASRLVPEAGEMMLAAVDDLRKQFFYIAQT